MTLPEFSQVFARLALQLRFTDADEATIRAYYEPLAHLELATVALAAERFASTPAVDVWFPKTPEWLAMVGRIRYERAEALRAALRRLPQPLCLDCEDTGMMRGTSGRYGRCRCQDQREREISGLRPLPALPPAPWEDRAAVATLETAAHALARRKSMA